MADSQLDDVDQLAAALAGFRAAGLEDQPFEMARRLINEGWSKGTTINVTAETLLQALIRNEKPMTWSALLQRVIGSQLGGKRYLQHKAEFQKLIDTGQVVCEDPEALYPRYLPLGHQL